MPVRVKICGLTTYSDAVAAIDAGAHALGFVFHAPSLRYITAEEAGAIIAKLPVFVTTVGVFVHTSAPEINTLQAQIKFNYAQIHGSRAIKNDDMVRVPVIRAWSFNGDWSAEDLMQRSNQVFLLDSAPEGRWGGTGVTGDWHHLEQLLRRTEPKVRRRLILAGGLSSQNVKRVIELIRPFAVDVSSSVEESPGRKDHHKMKEFIDAVSSS